MPFTTAQFLDVFARYNQAVWPAQVVLVALAVMAVFLAVRPTPGSGRAVTAVLAFFWAWMGIVYHGLFFARINPAAYLFGLLFVAQGALLAIVAVRRAPAFRPRADAAGIAGAALVAYALAGYPILGYVLGHRYPAAPTFGLPCPTTIFTIGLLLWTVPRVPWWLLAIPAAWAVVGTSAAASLGMTEDYGLLVAGVVGMGFVLLRHRPRRVGYDASLTATSS